MGDNLSLSDANNTSRLDSLLSISLRLKEIKRNFLSSQPFRDFRKNHYRLSLIPVDDIFRILSPSCKIAEEIPNIFPNILKCILNDSNESIIGVLNRDSELLRLLNEVENQI